MGQLFFHEESIYEISKLLHAQFIRYGRHQTVWRKHRWTTQKQYANFFEVVGHNKTSVRYLDRIFWNFSCSISFFLTRKYNQSLIQIALISFLNRNIIFLLYSYNIKWLKICDKSRRTSVPISQRLLGCLRMLQLQDVALDDVKHPWRRMKKCHTLLHNRLLRYKNSIFKVTNYCKWHKIFTAI